MQKGNYYFNVGGNGAYDLEKAEKYFNKALEIDPQVPDAWHQLARIDPDSIRSSKTTVGFLKKS